MRLSDRLNETTPLRPGTRCSVDLVKSNLDDVDTRDLDAALANVTLSATTIAHALQADGHTVRPAAIARHRRGECRCSQNV
jgi:hypothetical protein